MLLSHLTIKGVVYAAKSLDPDVPEGRKDVAIKKITKVFSKQILTKRTLREIKILRFFNGHENITSLLDMDIGNIHAFDEVFIVQGISFLFTHHVKTLWKQICIKL
jgi:mitogen-activated protein kinase 7